MHKCVNTFFFPPKNFKIWLHVAVHKFEYANLFLIHCTIKTINRSVFDH